MTDTETVPVIDWQGLNKNLSNIDSTIALFGQVGLIPGFGFMMLVAAKVSIPVWVGIPLNFTFTRSLKAWTMAGILKPVLKTAMCYPFPIS